ncbi:MAG: hypothetical protein AAFX87_16315 [Bacteroidota bacterium]
MNVGKGTIRLAMVTLLSFGLFSVSLAQDAVTDEELTSYAAMEDAVKQFKISKTAELKDWKTEFTKEKLGSVKRYNDLKKTKGDEAKLQELEATEEEIAYLAEIKAKEDELKEGIRALKIDLIKGENGIGAGVYNKVKKALKADADLKAKLEAKMQEIEANREATETEEDTAGTN